MSNVFHCVEDEEHVNKTSVEDVSIAIDYYKYFGKEMDLDLYTTGLELIANGCTNAEAHDWTHKLLEDNLISFVSREGLYPAMAMCGMSIMNSTPERYNYYQKMVEQTNKCGTHKYELISQDEFEKCYKHWEILSST